MDPKAALKQLQEATQFQADRQVLRLYDLISVEHYEETRKLVCWEISRVATKVVVIHTMTSILTGRADGTAEGDLSWCSILLI